MKNPQILDKLKEQFTLVTIDLYGNDDPEDNITILCHANEHTEKEINDLFEEYDEAYEKEEFPCAFEEYLEEKGINFYIV